MLGDVVLLVDFFSKFGVRRARVVERPAPWYNDIRKRSVGLIATSHAGRRFDGAMHAR